MSGIRTPVILIGGLKRNLDSEACQRSFYAGFTGLLIRFFLWIWCPVLACGQVPLNQRVLLVSNSAWNQSLAVARHYRMRRAIPEAHECRISVDSPDLIGQDEFDSEVKAPVRRCLEKAGKQTILYIVLSYLTPYDVTFGKQRFALDQLLADIWDEYLPAGHGSPGKPHPYFADAESQG